MKLSPRLLILALAAAPGMVWAALPVQPLAPHVSGEVIVKYRDAAGIPEKTAMGLRSRKALLGGQAELLELPAITDVAAAIVMLSANPAVEYAEPNYLRFPLNDRPVPNDPLFDRQWAIHNFGQDNFVPPAPGREVPASVPGADLNLLPAWDPGGDGTFARVGSDAVIVAIIDDAFDIDHEDLRDNFLLSPQFRNPRPDGSVDDQFHGTLVAGVLGADGNNGRGIAGATWRSRLMPLKVGEVEERDGVNRTRLDSASIVQAIEFARDNGAHIINASFGGPGRSQTEEDLIRGLAAHDILFVAAAGNDDANLDFSRIGFPALYDAPNLLPVAATNRQDNIASFSMYGPLRVPVAAPGLQIVTTTVGSTYLTGDGCTEGGNCGVSGTSFAAPYAAGIAALIRAHVEPTPGWREIKARLIESGTSLGNAGQRVAGGRIDAAAALDMTPRPSLVIQNAALANRSNRLDPGTTVNLEITVFNGWEHASNVSGTLRADGDVIVPTAAVALGDIAADGTAVATFPVTVAPGADGYSDVLFTLDLTADGYAASRSFIREIARLQPGDSLTQNFQRFAADDIRNAYDEFHTWHADVDNKPPGPHTLVVRTNTAGEDIDLLARASDPPCYMITLNADPNIPTGRGFFSVGGGVPGCTQPSPLVSGRFDGREAVTLVLEDTTPPQTYYFTVVNFAQLPLQYDLSVELLPGRLRPDTFVFPTAAGATPGTTVVSDPITVRGLSNGSGTFIYVGGGEYSVNNAAFRSVDGTVSNGDTVRVRTVAPQAGQPPARAELTIGGVTAAFEVTLGAATDRGGRSGGGNPGLWLLALYALLGAAAAYRR